MGTHDKRHIELADYLECSADLVERVFHTVGVDCYQDRQELENIRNAKEVYDKALSHLQKASASLDKLPEIEAEAFRLRGLSWKEMFAPIMKELEAAHTRTMNEYRQISGKGAPNIKANQVAEFVAQLFEELGNTITFGTVGIDNGPSTSFGRAVKKAIEIYDVRGPLTEAEKTEFRRALSKGKPVIWQGPVLTVSNIEDWGRLCDWRKPAKRAFAKRNRNT